MLSAPPAPRIPRPVPRRLPVHKAMTIALGMLANDGLVIAADSQITSGDWKTSHGKVSCVVWDADTATPISVVLTGAGTLSYIEAAWEAIRPCMKPGISMPTLKSSIAKAVQKFYREHIVPFGQFPDRPMIQLLIGVGRHRQQEQLWLSEFSPVINNAPYHAIGQGQNYAMSILERLYRLPLMDCVDTVILAGHVIKLVKDSDVSCGKWTEIVAIRHGTWREVSLQRVKEIDAASEYFGIEVEPHVFRRALGSGAAPITEWLDKSSFRKIAAELREEWRALDITMRGSPTPAKPEGE